MPDPSSGSSSGSTTAAFGIQNKSTTFPNLAIMEYQEESSVGIRTFRGASGNTEIAVPIKMVETKVIVSGIGGSIQTPTLGDNSGSIMLTGFTLDESNEDVPKFKAEFTSYSSLA